MAVYLLFVNGIQETSVKLLLMLVYTDADSRVVLLTNDINLRNKGIIMNIDCYSETVSYQLSNVSDWLLSNDY